MIVVSLVWDEMGIQEIYAMLNPEKLAFLQRQLSRTFPANQPSGADHTK